VRNNYKRLIKNAIVGLRDRQDAFLLDIAKHNAAFYILRDNDLRQRYAEMPASYCPRGPGRSRRDHPSWMAAAIRCGPALLSRYGEFAQAGAKGMRSQPQNRPRTPRQPGIAPFRQQVTTRSGAPALLRSHKTGSELDEHQGLVQSMLEARGADRWRRERVERRR
jgi:hypothetical protein